MRIFHPVFLAAAVCSTVAANAVQAPTNAAPAQGHPPSQAAPIQAPQAQAPPAQPVPSGLLKPSLDTVRQTLTALNLEKWKRGTVREEAADHISAIQRDMQDNLPPLLQDADAAPQTFSHVLPMYRNVDALYDVLLRVVEAARVSAPADQVTQLEGAWASLSKARHTLDDRLEDMAVEQEKQISGLRNTVQTQTAALHAAAATPPAAAPVPCKTPAPRPRAKKKPNPPPATPLTASPTASPKPRE
jgi:hypothetical protein